MVSEVFIKWQKDIDNAILGEIKEKAIEHGIKTEYILNEEAIISALKKQIPIKPKVLKVHDISNYKYGDCQCGEHIIDDDKYCSNCGQKIDWSDTE